MRLKRAIAMLAASAVCLGVFAGCGKEETVQQNHKIGLAMSLEDTALSILSNEVASYAESTGTELVKYNAEDDYETQLEQIAQCKADGCEAVIIVQTKNDAESTKAMIEAADGMEVIFANRMPAEDDTLHTAGAIRPFRPQAIKGRTALHLRREGTFPLPIRVRSHGIGFPVGLLPSLLTRLIERVPVQPHRGSRLLSRIRHHGKDRPLVSHHHLPTTKRQKQQEKQSINLHSMQK